MRKVLLVFLVLCSALGWATACPASYSNWKQIVLEKATNTDQTNFPYTKVFTYPSLKTVGNGGLIQNTAANSRSITGPADFVVCTGNNSGTLMKFIIPYYDATTGKIQLIVQIPTLHTASNDSYYIGFNNAAQLTSLQDYSLLSDANIIEWCHFGDGSTINLNCDVLNGTGTGSPAAMAGQVDGALSLSGTNYDTLSGTATVGGNNLTIEAWVYPTGGAAFYRIASDLNGSGNNGYLFGLRPAGDVQFYIDSSTTVHQVASGQVISGSVWSYIAASNDGSTLRTYGNAVAGATATGGAIGAPSQNLLVGYNADGTGNKFVGGIDELRISSVVRSADWISTTYNVERYNNFEYINDCSGSTPCIAQWRACAAPTVTIGSNAVCTMTTPVTSGNTLIDARAELDSLHCDTAPTSLAGFTYTQRAVADYTGAIHHYYSCFWTAPVTSTTTEIITNPLGNAAVVVYEMKNVSTTGVVATGTNTTSPPNPMTLTSPAANSFMTCGTKAGGTPPSSNSQGYSGIFSPLSGITEFTDHPAWMYTPYATVAAGSTTCSITGTFTDSAVMMMLFNAPEVTGKRVKAQMY